MLTIVEDDFLPLGILHVAFSNGLALIHVDRVFEENVFTSEGRLCTNPSGSQRSCVGKAFELRPTSGCDPSASAWRCCTARSKSLTSLCRLQSHPAQYVSGIPSAAILLSISHPIRCSTRCLANVRARISGPMIAL